MAIQSLTRTLARALPHKTLLHKTLLQKLTLAALLALVPTAAQAGIVVTFDKSFSPDTIGPGSSSTLIFTITNTDPFTPVDDLAFTDTLPAGMTIADPSSAFTDCTDAILSAPDSGTTIAFSEGRLGAGETCTVRVNVTSFTTGMNVSGTLTSDAGSHGTAAATLTVDFGRPGFSKSFSPSSVSKGGLSTLTFLVDNTTNAASEPSLSFLDDLPSGVVVAAAPDVATDCGAAPGARTISASPGSSSISFSYFGTTMSPAVPAGSICTFSVNVRATANGSFDNVSSELQLSDEEVSGFATDTLEVPLEFLNKAFVDDPVPPGGTVTLEFTVQNPDRANGATDVTFSDDLESVVTGLAPSGPLPADPCGAGSSLSFAAGVLTLSDGTLAPGGSCTFSVSLLVPVGTAPGSYGNTTTAVMATIDGDDVTGNTASDVLVVSTVPILIKTFTDDPVGAGGGVTLEFTIVNTSATSSATDIEFTDDLNTAILGLAANGLVAPGGLEPDPLVDPCGSGSELTIPDPNDSLPPFFPPLPPDPTMLIFTGGSLAPNDGMPGGPDTCTFSIVVDVPAGTPGGTYTNTTSAITATVDGGTKTGNPASGDVEVVGAPILTKEFTDDPTAPGGTVTLEFTLEHDPEAPGDATDVAFTDDLTTLVPSVPGLTATGVASNTCAGATVDLSPPDLIAVSGATLTPGETCAIAVTLAVPAGATSGLKENATSEVTAVVDGLAVAGLPGEDDLRIAGLIVTKDFLDDPAIPGGTVTLRFTLDNSSGAADATAISFDDDLDATLSGLMAVAPPPTPCGGTLVGTSTLMFDGGSVSAGDSCFFDVTLSVPATVTNPTPPPAGPIPSDGVYGNTTTAPTATIGGTPGFTLEPAFDDLVVDSELLALTKEFTDDPTIPGGNVTLEITVENVDPSRAASAITFSDDLGAALAGLTIDSVLFNDCGGTAAGVGTDMLTYTGGSLAAGATCTVRLLLDVPAGPLPGNTFTNTTSDATGTIAGLPVTGAAVSDDLRVFTLVLEKAFSGVTFPGGTVDLTFTITNLDSTAGASFLSFADDLPAGLSAVAPLPADPCGSGSSISGTTLLTFTGGSLAPDDDCTFTVTLAVPAGATPGSFPNVTSDLLSAGLPVGAPASDTLDVEPPPAFSKSFSPSAIGLGQTSTLTFTIDNAASTVAATDLAFTDDLPAGLAVANPPNASDGCGGTLTAPAGATTISYSGGTVGAGVDCTISVDVTASATGALVNTTGDLTSSSGNSGTASDTLVVDPQPGFSKLFDPNPVAAGGVSVLIFTIDNGSSTQAATGLAFSDTLPAGVVIASPSNAATDCTGGTLTAPEGGTTIDFSGGSVAAGDACVVLVDVTASSPGTYDNVSGDLTSSLGSSGTASDSLTVSDAPIFTKSFSPDLIAAGDVSTLTFTIDNGASGLAATSLDFTDNLPAGVTIASPSAATTDCSGGTLTAPDGGTTITYSGGSVAAGDTCTVAVDVTASSVGSYDNVSDPLTSSLGSSGTASDTLDVVDEEVELTKTFVTDPVLPGGLVELEFTLTNLSGLTLVDLTFSDDLDDALPGLAAVDTPKDDVCGAGSELTGTSEITLTGGGLDPNGSCTFRVTLRVPADADPGTYTCTTTPVTGEATRAMIFGTPASDDLIVAFLGFGKDFVGSGAAGGTVVLTFVLTNPDPVNGASDITFSDDLDAVLPGLEAVGLPQDDVCGTGSQVSGTSVVILTGGSLGPGESCSFDVEVEIPDDAPDGTFTNVTSALQATVGGSTVDGGPASAAEAPLSIGNVLDIPTLGGWGLYLLASLLGLLGLRRLRRR